jgi:GGDEF domain-containing protein
MLANLSATEASVIVQRCHHPVLITNSSGRVKSCNEALKQLSLATGLDVEFLAGVKTRPERASNSDREVGLVTLSKHGEGSELHFEVHSFALAGRAGERARMFIRITDRFERQPTSAAAQKNPARAALTDPTSGILSAHGLLIALQPHLARSNCHNSPLALLLLGLRRVNPRAAQIKKLVGVLNDEFRARDTIARTGATDFAVILPETSIESALNLADKLEQRLLLELPWVSAHGGRFGFGIAAFTSSDDAQSLLRRAASTLVSAVSALDDHSWQPENTRLIPEAF